MNWEVFHKDFNNIIDLQSKLKYTDDYETAVDNFTYSLIAADKITTSTNFIYRTN